MPIAQNLHTHTRFSDGKHTIEEMVQFAMRLGFHSLGISDHCPMPPENTYAMREEQMADYLNEIANLKSKYAEEICVYTGIELDFTADMDLSLFDYVIGSTHFLIVDGEYVDFDVGVEELKKVIDRYFGGDGMAFAKAYYKAVANEPKYSRVDIVGHFDLITKNLEKYPFFDTELPEYRNVALEALHAVAEKCSLFEINTGAIARGNRTDPYSSPFLLKEMKRLGCKIIISSDCHNGEYLNCHFSESSELARACGFTEAYVLTDKGFEPRKL